MKLRSITKAMVLFLFASLPALAAARDVKRDVFVSESFDFALVQEKIVRFYHPASQWKVQKNVLLGEVKGTWVAFGNFTGRTKTQKMSNGLAKTFHEVHFFSKSTEIVTKQREGQQAVVVTTPKVAEPIQALLISWYSNYCDDPGSDGKTLLLNAASIQAVLEWKKRGFDFDNKMHALTGVDVSENLGWAALSLIKITISPSQIQRLGLSEGPIDDDLYEEAIKPLEDEVIVNEAPYAIPEGEGCN